MATLSCPCGNTTTWHALTITSQGVTATCGTCHTPVTTATTVTADRLCCDTLTVTTGPAGFGQGNRIVGHTTT